MGAVIAGVVQRRWHTKPPQQTNPAAAASAPATTATSASPAGPGAGSPEADRPTAAPAPPEPARSSSALATRQLACTLADELADLVSGVEGSAHQLIDAAPNPARLVPAAEAMQLAVQRLRTLHTKLAAFGQRRAIETGSTALEPMLQQLGHELQELQLGLELHRESAAHLPPLALGPSAVHDALLFLSAAMLRAERGALHLAIACEPCFAGAQPSMQIELALEWRSQGRPPTGDLLSDPSFTLDLDAANHLVISHGGELTLDHLPGCSVRAVVRWPVLAGTLTEEGPRPATTPTFEPAAPPVPRPSHRYGGALVLEADPAVRAMLSQELKAAGRAVFACADSAAVRSFLEATPDRFELLLVDHEARLEAGAELAAAIEQLTPQLKIFVLSPGERPSAARWPQLHHLQKPFGVHELRAALASVIAAG